MVRINSSSLSVATFLPFTSHSLGDSFHFSNGSPFCYFSLRPFAGKRGFMVTLEEWQRWGSLSPLPTKVVDIIRNLELMADEVDAPLTFGGKSGKLQSEFKVREDKKHRTTYDALQNPEEKIQFYSARQIGCRLIGSREYLCQKCWLPKEEDCMCSKINPVCLWNKIRIWVYMHPKEFLRQNNTGKLLWQVFGVESATLCLFGVPEMEDMMWNALKMSGKEKVWCLYPSQSVEQKSLQDALDPSFESEVNMGSEHDIMNFILIDGTWSNSAAMFKRLKDQSKMIFGSDDLPCITLSTGLSTMHKLRPQPSWDRTCTAAAGIGLLDELQLVPGLRCHGLEKQAESLENSLVVLLQALTTRRLRMGRSITRKMRRGVNI